MVAAKIYKDHLLDLGAPCEEMTKTFSIGFNDAIRAKSAAVLFTLIHYLCIMAMLWFFVPRRSGIE